MMENRKIKILRHKIKLSVVLLILVIFISIAAGFAGGILAIAVTKQPGGIKNAVANLPIKKETLKLTEDSAIIDAVKKVGPSVVSITVQSQVQDFFGRILQQEGQGSGFIITSDGVIVTNKHVVSDSAAKYTVITSDGKNYSATIKALDPFMDLAIIKIEAANLPVADLGNSDDLQIGQHVIAIGNALGFQNSVTAGIISAKERYIDASDATGAQQSHLEGLLQTDAPINAGNSGGPLINLAGQVVGINVAVAELSQSVGFAIPINSVKSAIESYLKVGRIIRPMLGVRYIPITKEVTQAYRLPVTQGALLYSRPGAPAIVPGGPADKAGLKEGDIITAVNGEKIDEGHSLGRFLQKYMPGDIVEITFVRQGREEKVKVTLGELK